MPPDSDPRCTGTWAACETRRPAASNSATEQSLRSLMLLEKDERISVLPISSVMDSRRLLNTSISMGSNTSASPRDIGAVAMDYALQIEVHDEVAVLVGACLLTGQHHGGRAHFLDHGRPGHRHVHGQQRTAVNRRICPAAGLEIDRAAFFDGAGQARSSGHARHGGPRHQPHRPHAQVDDLDGASGGVVAVFAYVRRAERSYELFQRHE